MRVHRNNEVYCLGKEGFYSSSGQMNSDNKVSVNMGRLYKTNEIKKYFRISIVK